VAAAISSMVAPSGARSISMSIACFVPVRTLRSFGSAGSVIRQPKAYPIYDGEYKEALEVIPTWIKSFENLQTVGRNGLHRYNNRDHSMLSAMLAARNILGEQHDVWNVNVERSYHEEFVAKKPKAPVAAAST
jgi:hypothetical protein